MIGKIQIHNMILNFPAQDFLIRKIKEQEIQNSFCRSLPYFSIYPAKIRKCVILGKSQIAIHCLPQRKNINTF